MTSFNKDYIKFYKHHFALLSSTEPTLKTNEKTQKISQMWKAMSKSEKENIDTHL